MLSPMSVPLSSPLRRWSVGICASVCGREWMLYVQRKQGFSLAASLNPAASHRAGCLEPLQGSLPSVL